MKKELQCINGHQKSFYGKAWVNEIWTEEGIIYELTSYSTKVCVIRKDWEGNKKVELYGLYSNTTTRHIKEFLQQYGMPVGTSKELLKMYCS